VPRIAENDQVGANGAEKNYTRLFGALGLDLRAPSASGEALAAECPWCFKHRFHVNVYEGTYHCKHCGEGGNYRTLIAHVHATALEETTCEDYLDLKARRGIASQTLEKHRLAHCKPLGCWLLPFFNAKGNPVNLQRYRPDEDKGRKYMFLPGLPTALYGFDQLATADRKKPVLLCEGVFDAIATDYNLGYKHRDRYCVVASPGTLKEDWAPYFEGRKVRALYDNDDGGEQHRERARKLLGESGVASELLLLKWPKEYPKGYDLNDLVSQHPKVSIPKFSLDHGVRVTAKPKLLIGHGRRQSKDEREIEWVWEHHLRCGTYASFSGKQGVFKTNIAVELVARYTAGRPMPAMDKPSMPAGAVLYVHAEDDRDKVENTFERAGGDFDKWHCLGAQTRDGAGLNILEHLREIEECVREYGIRFVVIDGQNSVVGTPHIQTDMLARNHVSGPLHRFAQKLNVALLGIRNEDNTGRALGPQSMGDIARCVWRAWETEPKSTPPYCYLNFVKVSDTARANYPAIPYSVQDLSAQTGDKSALKILWGEKRPQPVSAEDAAQLAEDLEGGQS
jgi:hypothetical protein